MQYELKKKELRQEAADYAQANRIKSRDYVQRYVQKKLNYFTPMVEVINERLVRFNPAYFEITEIWDHLADEFDMFVITGCEHFIDVQNAGVNGECNAYVEVMR